MPLLDEIGGDNELLVALFQMTFAIITPALIIGATVERAKLGFIVAFSVVWMLLVYAPVAHMVWGGGLLSGDSMLGWVAGIGVQDLAGGIVVHETAGIAAPRSSGDVGQPRRVSKGCETSTPTSVGDDRRGHAVGRLVWLQRRQRFEC